MSKILTDPPEIYKKYYSNDHHPDARNIGKRLFSYFDPILEVYSESKNIFAGTHLGNLYLREPYSDKYVKIIKPDNGSQWSLDNALWSPNGSYFAGKQVDETKVSLIEVFHRKEDKTTYKTFTRAGGNLPKSKVVIVNLVNGIERKFEYDSEFPYVHILRFSEDNSMLFLIRSDRLMKQVDLIIMDVETGSTKIVFSEKSKTYIIGHYLSHGYSSKLDETSIVSFLEDRNQFVWKSERSGFNQLYLYSLEGNLIRQLTYKNSNGIVDVVETVDKTNNYIYFTSRSNPDKPYEIQLYRTSLIIDKIELVTGTSGIFQPMFSENKDSIWVLRSKLPDLMRFDLYSPEGEFLGTPWQDNMEHLEKGKLNVSYVPILAADGTTQLEAMILKPVNFDPDKKYPVVEHIYGGAWSTNIIRDHFAGWNWILQKLADNGFVVVIIDGRGTAHRGKLFQDFSFGKFGMVELRDHISGLEQLGKMFSFMDINRVGIVGHSLGGHFALRAVLEAPNIYKAAHINAPVFDPIDFRIWIEPYMGCLPQDCPEKYEKAKVSNKLKDLSRPLMISHGEEDDAAPLKDSNKFVEKLKKVNFKNYDYLVYPNTDHIVMRNNEWSSAMIQFFNKHLNNSAKN